LNSSAPFYFDISSSIEGVIVNQTQITTYTSQIILGKDSMALPADDQFTFDFEPAKANAKVAFSMSYTF
jgi:hypothetical protein